MPRPILHFSGQFDESKLKAFIATSERIHHFGRPEPIFERQPFRVTYERGAPAPFAVYRCSALDRYILRRTASDARSDPSDCYALAIIEAGRMDVKQANATLTVETGGCALIPMKLPYVVDQMPSISEGFKAIYTFISANNLLYFRSTPRKISKLDAASDDINLLRSIMELLLEGDGKLGSQTCRFAFLEIVSQVNRISSNISQLKITSKDDDLWNEAFEFISKNFSDSTLNLEKLSTTLGRSKRILNYVFSRHRTTFANTLWSVRLNVIREWLATPDMAHTPIGQLAYAAGFKNSSHLSAKFRAVMRCTPSQFRKAALSDISVGKI